ncbi:MAG: cellulose biosynthesis protein BcsG [Gammaproteobacteria bacterium]|nr:cellulose biosynthesis protein BcsG [Gammaproteobacteria bacterium]
MGLWSAYFLGKLALYGLGRLDFSPWLNLALAVFTALPPRNVQQRFAKNLIALPLGIVLLYHDSFLPPLPRALEALRNLSTFSAAYLAELAGRVLSGQLVASVAATALLYGLARRKLRLSTFVFAGILAVLLAPTARHLAVATVPRAAAATGAAARAEVDLTPPALDQQLAEFYAQQKQLHVRFNRAAADEPAFDIVLLHVCSLSWDDLRTLQVSPAGLFGSFDLLLTNFGSGASYSGPAAIRLLRGACGETPEARLYDPAEAGCLVVDGLQNAGFAPQWAMNHDGHFGNFFADVRDRGGVTVPLEDNSGASVAETAFDGTPVYSDYSVLSRWWAKRQSEPAPRVVLYYNSISLHDGNRLVTGAHSDSSYGARLTNFSRDVGRFLELLRASGRRVVVVLIAEHGAALGGDRRQIQGLREIPTAAIARVPVAITLINGARPAPGTQLKIDDHLSYPALNEILARFISHNPFLGEGAGLGDYVATLPRTAFVAENAGTTVIEAGTHYMMRAPDGSWSSLDGIDDRAM